MRVALGVEFDGAGFSGWETQRNARTVQSCLEQALSTVADHPLRTVCAGRTDAGVHARGQVVHFDSPAKRSMKAWVFGANVNLPRDVCVTWAQPVDEAFHARFTARRRSYRYVILNRTVRPAVLGGRVTWECRSLSEAAMRSAAAHLVGEHDFSAYRATACQAPNPVRTLHRLDVDRQGDFLCIDLEANAFLHHMVRNIAGVLMAVGMGKAQPEWSLEVLESRDRTQGGVTAPPDGLYLLNVEYPPEYGLPQVSPDSVLW